MTLQKRLLTAFFIMILIQMLLGAVLIFGVARLNTDTINNKYNIAASPYELLGTSATLMNQYTESTYVKLIGQIEKDADILSDETYLEKVNNELVNRYSYLVVRDGDKIIYAGSDDMPDDIEESLPKYNDGINDADISYYIGKNKNIMVRKIDFTNSNISKGSAFMICQAQNVSPEIKSFGFQIFLIIFSVLIFSSFFLGWWIYKGFLNPLQQLKGATQSIKEGNLDFTITTDSGDEIQELFENFEEMRYILKTTAEEKIENDRENKELISNISHDLKTPITAVKGYVEGIMDGVADTPEKMDRYIKTIYNKANEMDALINELTLYSRIDSNRIPYTFNKINVADFFEDCTEELSLDLESKNIDLEFKNNVDRDVLIIADSEQLSRVINNIVGNSVKYIDKPKGHIKIRIKDVGDFVQVEIEDNGKGIAQKDIPMIFDRFYRTDASRNSSLGGSGIGLSIVKKIVEDHGGKVWASSKESEGTTMYFVLRKYQEVVIDE